MTSSPVHPDLCQVEEMSKLYESMKTMYEEMSKKLAAKEMQEQLENLKKQLKMDQALEKVQQEEDWRKRTVQAEPKPKKSSRSIAKKGKKVVEEVEEADEEDNDKPEFDQFADGDGDSTDDAPTTSKGKKKEHKKKEVESVPTPAPTPEPTKSRKWSDQWKVGAACWRVWCCVHEKPCLDAHAHSSLRSRPEYCALLPVLAGSKQPAAGDSNDVCVFAVSAACRTTSRRRRRTTPRPRSATTRKFSAGRRATASTVRKNFSAAATSVLLRLRSLLVRLCLARPN